MINKTYSILLFTGIYFLLSDTGYAQTSDNNKGSATTTTTTTDKRVANPNAKATENKGGVVTWKKTQNPAFVETPAEQPKEKPSALKTENKKEEK